MGKDLTTYEAHKRSGLTVGYIRQLLAKGKLKGRRAKTTDATAVWLIESDSLKQFLSSVRKRGPKPK